MNEEQSKRLSEAAESILQASEALEEARDAIGDRRFESDQERDRSAAAQQMTSRLDNAGKRIEDAVRKGTVAAAAGLRPGAFARYREAWTAVREGRVAPGWREVEHDLEKLFTPKLESVSSASRGELALRQLVRPVQPAPETSQTGWLVRRDDMNRLQAEIRAAQDAYDEAAVGREAEVEVEIDGQGIVIAVRLILPSGSREFDREALRAVQQAVRVRSPHDPQGPVIARYGLRGEVAVNLPRIGSAVEPNGGQVHSQLLSLGGTFDEVTGKADVRVPFKKRLKTRIRLISVRRKLAPAAQ
jgi:TonB family protein